MIADLSIIPVGTSPHTSDLLAEVLKVVAASGIKYQLTPTATCLEGSWEQITDLAKKCHDKARENAPHVVTFLKIEDDEMALDKLRRNVESVEEKAGMDLVTEPASRGADKAAGAMI